MSVKSNRTTNRTGALRSRSKEETNQTHEDVRLSLAHELTGRADKLGNRASPGTADKSYEQQPDADQNPNEHESAEADDITPQEEEEESEDRGVPESDDVWYCCHCWKEDHTETRNTTADVVCPVCDHKKEEESDCECSQTTLKPGV
jgi:rubrerythrin